MIKKLKDALTIFENAKFVNYIDLVLKTGNEAKMKIYAQKHNAFGKMYYIFDLGLINKSTGNIESADSIISTVFETIDEFIDFLSMSMSRNKYYNFNDIEITNMQEFLLDKDEHDIKNLVKERGYEVYEKTYDQFDVTNFENPAKQLMDLWLKNKYSTMRIKVIEKNRFETGGEFDNIYIYDLFIPPTNNHVIAISDPEDDNMIKVIYGWGDECCNAINELIS